MKKGVLFVLALLNVMSVFSQRKWASEEKDISKGSNVIHFGVGLPGYVSSFGVVKGAYYSYSRSPLIVINHEYVFNDKVKNSYMGLGPYLSYYGWKQESYSYKNHPVYGTDGWRTSVNVLTIAGRFFYHHKFLMGAKWDVYGAATAGLRFNFVNYTSYPSGRYSSATNGVDPAYGASVGIRYFFTDNFGVYAETGFGSSWATGGLNLKF